MIYFKIDASFLQPVNSPLVFLVSMTAPVIPVAALKLGETNMKVTGEISFPLVLMFVIL